MTADNVELVRAFHLRLWGSGDRTAIDDYVHSSAVTSMTGFEGSSAEVIAEDFDRYRGAFEDIATEIVDLLGADDRVALSWRTAGTHVGPYGDIAPVATGKRITMEGVDFFRIVDAKVVEIRSFWDAAAVYRQFGLLADGL